MLKRVAESISRYSMFEPGHSVGVAVSGGADSMALVEVLHEWVGLRLTVLHMNHGLRGEESEEDARFVERTAKRLGLPLVVELGHPGGGNLEEEARRLRRDFFLRAMKEYGLDRVATGHTRSDQAETVLFRVLRGTGPTGLAGILPVTAEGLVRPLLEVSREEVRDYLVRRGIAWREDSSNREPRFARNRIRHDLLPELRRDWNPGIEGALAQLGDFCREDESYWQGEAARLLEQVVSERRGAAMVFDVARLGELPRAAARRVLRSAIGGMHRDCRGVDFDHVEEILRLALQEAGSGKLELPGLEVCRSFDRLRMGPVEAAPKPYRLELPVPGEIGIPGTRRRVRVERLRGAEESRYNTGGVRLDGERIAARLELRSWESGDRFQPSGKSRRIKLKDLFQEARIPSWERPAWPIVTDGATILWVSGFPPAEGYGASGTAKEVIQVSETEDSVGT